MFDGCEPLTFTAPDATDAQLASIDAAIGEWRAVGVAALTGSSADSTLEIVFEPAGSAFYGYYDGSSIYINSALTDDSKRAITIAHELGHALGLVHVPANQRASVMNPGNLVVAPTSEDASAIAARWGECALDAARHL